MQQKSEDVLMLQENATAKEKDLEAKNDHFPRRLRVLLLHKRLRILQCYRKLRMLLFFKRLRIPGYHQRRLRREHLMYRSYSVVLVLEIHLAIDPP